jgi:hypothetical protein
MNADSDKPICWPALPLEAWKDTRDTLHMWTQMVGKVRLRLTPLVNHWWNVPLYVSANGLTTARIPYFDRAFELRFDFLGHKLALETSDGIAKSISLAPRTVADFYSEFIEMLHSTRIDVKIWTMPVEVPNPIPFEKDQEHRSYDSKYVERFWRILLSVDAVLNEFRSRFIGKSSPVHFFWGSFDLAVTRFSGRKAPDRPGADPVTREAYSHEVSSVGYWPGGGGVGDGAFYSYASPVPEGFKDARVGPTGSYFDPNLGEFILMYEVVQKAQSPTAALLEFCQSTYEAAAALGNWNRGALER